MGRVEKGECDVDRGPHWTQFCLRTMGNGNCCWELGTSKGSSPDSIHRAKTTTLLLEDHIQDRFIGQEIIKPLLVFQHLIATFTPSFTLRPQKWVLGGLQDVLSYSCPHCTEKVGWTWQGRILKQTTVFKATVTSGHKTGTDVEHGPYTLAGKKARQPVMPMNATQVTLQW